MPGRAGHHPTLAAPYQHSQGTSTPARTWPGTVIDSDRILRYDVRGLMLKVPIGRAPRKHRRGKDNNRSARWGMALIDRPASDECSAYYMGYAARVPDCDVLTLLDDQIG